MTTPVSIPPEPAPPTARTNAPAKGGPARNSPEASDWIARVDEASVQVRGPRSPALERMVADVLPCVFEEPSSDEPQAVVTLTAFDLEGDGRDAYAMEYSCPGALFGWAIVGTDMRIMHEGHDGSLAIARHKGQWFALLANDCCERYDLSVVAFGHGRWEERLHYVSSAESCNAGESHPIAGNYKASWTIDGDVLRSVEVPEEGCWDHGLSAVDLDVLAGPGPPLHRP